MVPMDASSSWESATSSRPLRAPAAGSCSSSSIRDSSPCRIRSRNSPAAFSVKVMAAICPIRAVPAATISTTRLTTEVVLPVPAAASTISVVSWSRRMRSRPARSGSRGGCLGICAGFSGICAGWSGSCAGWPGSCAGWGGAAAPGSWAGDPLSGSWREPFRGSWRRFAAARTQRRPESSGTQAHGRLRIWTTSSRAAANPARAFVRA